MKLYQSLRILGAALMMAVGVNAWAGDLQSYNEAAFKKAQADGKTVVLDFHADWCSTCSKQKPVLESLLNEEGFSSVVGFTVNYDKAKDLIKNLKVQKQSTLIVYKGKEEKARDMGLTDEAKIKALVMKGI